MRDEARKVSNSFMLSNAATVRVSTKDDIFAELEVTQCTGWMHCVVGGWVAAHFYTAISAKRVMFNNAVTWFVVPLEEK